MMIRKHLFVLAALLLLARTLAFAQAPTPVPVPRPPEFTSPEVTPDHRIIFRIYAPDAKSVSMEWHDLQAVLPQMPPFVRNDLGIWETTSDPVPPGPWRYFFRVDGVQTADPRNPETSENLNFPYSLAVVPGSDWLDERDDVPHGQVDVIHYHSSALGRMRRMHVYTPPGYENSNARYPVLYLLHGSGDCDESWSTVGRANFILDNLIAAGKAIPMIIVMPAGHTSRRMQGPPPGGGPRRDEFSEDFMQDIVPYVEKHYRALTDRDHTAIAGLSMGGGQTIELSATHPERFGYVGVFSAGVFSGMRRSATGAMAAAPSVPAEWVQSHPALDNAELRKGLKLIWLGTGNQDSLMPITQATVAMYKEHGYNPVFVQSEGGHFWTTWRDYLHQFAPLLFR